MSVEVLQGVITRVAEVARGGRLPVVVLDLDSTVFDTGPRHLRILRDFAGQRGHDGLERIANALSPADFGWGIDEPVRELGISDEALLADLLDFWNDRFFTSQYCAIDEPAPGAVTFARAIVEKGGLVYYLTGRPADAMHDGTLLALRRAGFPALRGRSVLHMKPSPHLADHRFKQAAIAEIHSLHGVVVCTAENEPAHANMLRQAFPEAVHLLYRDVHSPGAPQPDPALVRIADFHR
jgi:phosphoglycolate phosphatase-like HAD superfamily hydrolase